MIPIKPKQCRKCPTGVLKPIWKNIKNEETGKSEKYCREHAMAIYAKGKQEEKKEQFTKDEQFYQGIWERNNHVCFECGEKLSVPNGTPKNKITFAIRWFIHHIASKSKYPYLRYIEENTVLLCKRHHIQIEDAVNAPKMKTYNQIEQMKKELLGQ